MFYKEKVAVFSEIRANTQRKASALYNFWTLYLVVRKETARLLKVKVNSLSKMERSGIRWE